MQNKIIYVKKNNNLIKKLNFLFQIGYIYVKSIKV